MQRLRAAASSPANAATLTSSKISPLIFRRIRLTSYKMASNGNTTGSDYERSHRVYLNHQTQRLEANASRSQLLCKQDSSATLLSPRSHPGDGPGSLLADANTPAAPGGLHRRGECGNLSRAAPMTHLKAEDL